MKRRRRPTQSFFSRKGEAAVRLRHFQADAVAHQAGHWRSEIYPSWIDLRIEQKQLHPRRLHPGRLTWNLQTIHLERKMIFQTFIIMFHVNLPRCNSLNLKMVNWKMILLFQWCILRFHVNLLGCTTEIQDLYIGSYINTVIHITYMGL